MNLHGLTCRETKRGCGLVCGRLGAAATTVAALLKEPERWRDRAVVLIMCGGNISESTFNQARALAGSGEGSRRIEGSE